MGMSYILSLIAGIAMTVILGTQVAPSMIEQIKVKKVEATTINNQEVIFEGVQRYITMKQKNPTTIQEIIDEKFISSKVNNNGFDGVYSIIIDDTKGLLKIKTTITDPKAQEIFIKSFKNKFTPERVGTTDEFETTFVIPMNVMHGSGLFMSGIPTQDTPPDLSKYKYWYDTSGKETVLKVSNGLAWKKVAGLSGNQIGEDVLVDGSGSNYTKDSLPSQENSQVGDIKYAYDSVTNTIQEYVYSGATKGWVAKSGGGGQSHSIMKNGTTRYWSNNTYASSCLEYIKSGSSFFPYQGATGDGVYKIDPDGTSGPIAPFDVYCDMTIDGGGWTLIANINLDSDFGSCGPSLIPFFKNGCGNVNNINKNTPYSLNSSQRNSLYKTSMLFTQFLDGVLDLDDAFIITLLDSNTDLFPNTENLVHTKLAKACDINNSNCDTTDVYWKYSGDYWFHSAWCFSSRSDVIIPGEPTAYSRGAYGLCHNGVKTDNTNGYKANSLFGNRSGWDELKTYSPYSAPTLRLLYQEKLWYR